MVLKLILQVGASTCWTFIKQVFWALGTEENVFLGF